VLESRSPKTPDPLESRQNWPVTPPEMGLVFMAGDEQNPAKSAARS
jgi:hypothetical protein